MSKPDEPPDVNTNSLRTAEILIERHGGGALAFAQAQAEQLAKGGNAASAAEWRGIAAAIRAIEARKKRR